MKTDVLHASAHKCLLFSQRLFRRWLYFICHVQWLLDEIAKIAVIILRTLFVSYCGGSYNICKAPRPETATSH